MKIPKPKEPITGQEPFTLISNYENTMKLLDKFFPEKIIVEDNDLYTSFHHPESNNSGSAAIAYKDTGVFHTQTYRYPPLVMHESYTTVQLIKCLEGEFEREDNSEQANRFVMDYIEEEGWWESKKKPGENGHGTSEDTETNGNKYTFHEPIVLRSLHDQLQEVKDKPIEEPIIPDWVYKGGVAWLFGSTGAGKTFWSVEVADKLARGQAIEPFKQPAKAHRSLYLNFEMNLEDMRRRYTKGEEPKPFHPGLITLTEEQRRWPWTDMDFLKEALTHIIKHYTNIDVVWIDNLTYLLPNMSDVKEASAFIRYLNEIADETGLAFVVINHPTKAGEAYPFDENSMAGGKALTNLGGTAVSIRKSGILKNHFVVKEVKTRHTKDAFDGDKCCLYEIGEGRDTYVAPNFLGHCTEEEHMKGMHKAGGKVNEKQIIKQVQIDNVWRMDSSRFKQSEMALALGLSQPTISRILKAPKPPE